MLIKYRVTGGSLCFRFTGAISEAYYSLKQLLHIWRLVSDHGKFFGLSFFRLQINIQIILGFIGMVIKCSSHYSFIVENLSWQLFNWINFVSIVPLRYINYYLPSKCY